MIDALPAPGEPELAAEPPEGVLLEYLAAGGIRVQVQISRASQALLAVPRIGLLLSVLAVVIESWRHHLFIAFWFFGLPFLRWLRGPRQSSLLIGERALEVEGAHWFGGTRSLPRAGINSVTIGRAGPLRLFQRALVLRDRDRQTTLLFVGISAVQADFVNGGVQRWLADEG